MKPLVYVGIAMHPEAEAYLSSHAQVTHDPKKLPEADGAIVYSPEADWPRRAGFDRLKAIGCHVCEEPVTSWAAEKGAAVTEAGSLWRTVAEHTLALLMAAVRQIPAADQAVRRGQWTDHEHLKIRFSGHDFQGRTLGIWGLGQIGLELARMLQGFQMRVLYNDLIRNEQAERDLGLGYCDPDTLLRESDYFVLLLPLCPETRGILGAREFARMKPGCVFINTARAGIVDRTAFLEAMRSGRIAAAALDVQWDEPLPTDDELLGFDNLLFTPHLGGSTYECDMVLADGVLEALK